MKKKISNRSLQLHFIHLLCTMLIFGWSISFSQELSGNLKHHTNQELKLMGYNGLETVELAKSSIDALGNFKFKYKNYKGTGYLETSDDSKLFIVINEPNIEISGSHLKEPDNIMFKNSIENDIFNQYAVEHNQRERALAGWKYLLPQYQNTKILKQKDNLSIKIQSEIDRLEKEDQDFLDNIKTSQYVFWFLPLRKLIDDIPLSAQQFTERIPKHIADFRAIDFKDIKLYHSGILADLLESHYWLIENSGRTIDSMYEEMNASTDVLVEKLQGNDKLLNEVSDFLFHFLEKRSLYRASEHLALKLLTLNSCTLEDKLANQMETYRAMKIGNRAPDIHFSGKKIMMGTEVKTDLKLSDFNSDYTLVVFGASWCSKCNEEIPQIMEKYIHWKLKGVETVFVSLDHDELEFANFAKSFPFLSFWDGKAWNSKSVQDYYVFAAPTLFLLDKNREIILRPSTVNQIDAWVNYKLETKN